MVSGWCGTGSSGVMSCLHRLLSASVLWVSVAQRPASSSSSPRSRSPAHWSRSPAGDTHIHCQKKIEKAHWLYRRLVLHLTKTLDVGVSFNFSLPLSNTSKLCSSCTAILSGFPSWKENVNWDITLAQSHTRLYFISRQLQHGTWSEWHHWHRQLSVCFHDGSVGAVQRRGGLRQMLSSHLPSGWTCMRQQPADRLWQSNSIAWGH